MFQPRMSFPPLGARTDEDDDVRTAGLHPSRADPDVDTRSSEIRKRETPDLHPIRPVHEFNRDHKLKRRTRAWRAPNQNTTAMHFTLCAQAEARAVLMSISHGVTDGHIHKPIDMHKLLLHHSSRFGPLSVVPLHDTVARQVPIK